MQKLILSSALALAFAPACLAEYPEQICFKDTCVKLEIADNDLARQTGLMFRTSLARGSGMLFVFPEEGIHSFWMKNTLIGLDMIWMDRDLNIVDIKSSVPVCDTGDCPIYTPQARALYVLEVNAGFCGSNKINIKDKAFFKDDRTGK